MTLKYIWAEDMHVNWGLQIGQRFECGWLFLSVFSRANTVRILVLFKPESYNFSD